MAQTLIFYPIKKVLLPTDGSEYSLKAAKYCAEIAKKHGSEVTLLHVMPLHLPSVDHPIELHSLDLVVFEVESGDVIKARGKKVMEKTKAIFDELHVPVKTEYFSFGNIPQIIIETAKNENFDLIIMGHKGVGGLKHVMLGSVAERVCRNAPCPVLIVR